jgi:4a-hydroxytetrahydrobiopterin dehydratase
MDLVNKKCVPCEGGIPKLTTDRIQQLLTELRGWQEKDEKLCKSFQLKDFVAAIAFVNRVAELAEKEGHHPDFSVHYSRVDFTIFTHAVGGLSENDFILAAKIDALA